MFRPHKIFVSPWPLWIFILAIALTNYQLAKVGQRLALQISPSFSYQLALAIPWILISALPLTIFDRSGFNLNRRLLLKNSKELTAYILIVFLGLVLFYIFGLTKYFHSVTYPILFFVVTPLAEEILFRGWIFNELKKHTNIALFGSAFLFGIHHLQYFGYKPTPFALFQIAYTFVLGLLFARMRQKSGSIFIPILVHMFINWFTVSY